MRRLDLPKISFLDCRGDRRLIAGLSLQSRRVFSAHLAIAVQLQLEEPGRTIGWLYDNNREFQACIDDCLEICGLSPEYCSAAQVHGLFFAYEGGPGLLLQVEFPDAPSNPARLLDPERDPYHAAIAAVWSHSPDLSLIEVREILEEIPWDEVSGAIAERNRIIKESDPKWREEEAERRVEAELAAYFSEEFPQEVVAGVSNG